MGPLNRYAEPYNIVQLTKRLDQMTLYRCIDPSSARSDLTDSRNLFSQWDK